jgi:ABC-2 type transport system ATP-binding protein
MHSPSPAALVTNRDEPRLRATDLFIDTKSGFVLTIPEFTLHPGDICAVIGPNGSGKTSFIEACLGLRKLERGVIELLGDRVGRTLGSTATRKALGCQLQRNTYARDFKVTEVVALHRTIYGRADNSVFDALDLGPLMKKTYTKLSGGQRQRVDLYVALAHAPDLLVLDEPGTGLDLHFTAAFAQLLHTRSQLNGVSVLMASHKAEEIEIANRVLVMRDGNMVADLSVPDGLAEVIGRFRYRLQFHAPQDAEQAAQHFATEDVFVRVIKEGDHSVSAFASDDMNTYLNERFAGRLKSYSFSVSSFSDLLEIINRADAI